MGWSSGTRLIGPLWEDLQGYIPKKHQAEAAAVLIERFEEFDWDNLDEVPELLELALQDAHFRKTHKLYLNRDEE